MKKSFFLALMFVFASLSAAFANDAINVTIDGEPVVFEGQQPVNVGGRTLVPVRGVFEMLGFDVDWNSESQQATLTNENYTMIITIGNQTFTTNGESHALDVPAQNIGGRTMVPIRLPLESVGFKLDWDNETNTVLISQDAPEPTAPAPIQEVRLDIDFPGTRINPETGLRAIIINGEPLILDRAFFARKFSFEIAFDGNRQVTLTRDNDVIVFNLTRDTFTVNGESRPLTAPAQAYGGYAALPIRYVVESIGYTMNWDSETNKVVITTEE
jgi:hypothetical protein